MTRRISVTSLLFVSAIFGASCGGVGDSAMDIPDLERYDYTYLDEISQGEDDEFLIIDGSKENKVRVWSDDPAPAPLSGKNAAFWWVEVYNETPESNQHIVTRIDDRDVYIELDGKLIKVDSARRGGPPQLHKTYKIGREPENYRTFISGLTTDFYDITYDEWVLEQGKEYTVSIAVSGGAYLDENEEVVYETYYLFFFK